MQLIQDTSVYSMWNDIMSTLHLQLILRVILVILYHLQETLSQSTLQCSVEVMKINICGQWLQRVLYKHLKSANGNVRSPRIKWRTDHQTHTPTTSFMTACGLILKINSFALWCMVAKIYGQPAQLLASYCIKSFLGYNIHQEKERMHQKTVIIFIKVLLHKVNLWLYHRATCSHK